MRRPLSKNERRQRRFLTPEPITIKQVVEKELVVERVVEKVVEKPVAKKPPVKKTVTTKKK